MSSRVGGAVLALTAAALLAVSIATSAWWSGHPEVNGTQTHRMDVHVGLIGGAEGCMVGEGVEDRCQRLPLGNGFIFTKYAELAATGALALCLIVLGALTLKRSERRRSFAKVVMVVAGVSAIVALVLILQGPDIKSKETVVVPFGYGLYLFFAGTAMSILTGLLTMLPEAKRTSPGWATPTPPMMQPPPPPPVDVLALLQEDMLRPTALGPEPKMGRPMPSSPGGMLPGPSGHLAPLPSSGPQQQPLFSTSPQLRPLYDATPSQGGTSGYVPAAPPQLPIRGPTPLPHAAVSAMIGLPTPIPTAPPPSKTLPPPLRTKPLSVAPPSIPAIPPMRPTPPPPTVGRATPQRSQPTIASAAVPPPPLAVSTPGATLAGPPGMKLPVRPETDADDRLETVDFEKQTVDREFDAAATVARDEGSGEAPFVKRQPADTDPLFSTGDSTSPSVPFETATSESRPYATDASEAQDSSDDETATRAREKISSSEIDPPVEPPERTSAAVLTSAVPPPRLTPVPTKVPMSTAPQSLPPPQDKPSSATSGPSPACPQCEAPMAWVEEHLRFYCKSCRMYF